MNVNNSQLIENLSLLIKEIAGEDVSIEVTPETTFNELDFDSIKFISLVIRLEEVVDKDMEEIVARIDLSEIKTVQDLATILISLNNN